MISNYIEDNPDKEGDFDHLKKKYQEFVATIQQHCFYSLESPIQRVCGYDTPFPLVFEKQYIPDALKNYEAIKNVMESAR